MRIALLLLVFAAGATGNERVEARALLLLLLLLVLPALLSDLSTGAAPSRVNPGAVGVGVLLEGSPWGASTVTSSGSCAGWLSGWPPWTVSSDAVLW